MNVHLKKLISSKKYKDITVLDSIVEELNKCASFFTEKEYKLFLSSRFIYYSIIFNLSNIYSRYLEYKPICFATASKKRFILLFGESEGNIRYSQMVEFQRNKNTFNYKKEKYGYTQEDFVEFNKSRSVTLELCIKRHGDKAGREKWETYCKRQSFTNSLEYFVEKLGVKAGREKWEQVNFQKGHSLESYEQKHGIEVGLEKYKEYNNTRSKRIAKTGSSNLEVRFAESIEKHIPNFRDIFKYGYYSKQFMDFTSGRGNVFYYDFVSTSLKIAIEINGDYWHCNPVTYSKDYYHKQINMTAADIWEHDSNKRQTLENRGFTFITIWESDINKKLESIIMEIENVISSKMSVL